MPSDIGETNNVAAAHPGVVKSPTGKMNGWAESLGAALSHEAPPARLNPPPAPEGDVLKVTVTVTGRARPSQRLLVQVATFQARLYATDYLEYDLAAGPDSLPQGFYFTPFKGNNAKAYQATFTRYDGVDQFGRDQSEGPPVKGGPGVWEHRVIGLSTAAPGVRPRYGFVFHGGKAGVYTVHLDNLRIRHADGSATPVWTSGADTKYPKVADSAEFKAVRVNVEPAASVRPNP